MSSTLDFITEESIAVFKRRLIDEEREPGTVQKYIRDVIAFSKWLDGKAITKETVCGWKEHLLANDYKPVTVNSMLAAVNTYCRFSEIPLKAKFLRIQHKSFCEVNRDLKKCEYEQLLCTAEKLGKERLFLLIETIGATGIRVSEVKYITVEALGSGKAEISLKGKIRTILLPLKLCRRLLKYAKKQKITSGEVFITRSGRGISRKQIWAEMKNICKKAGVEATKVFPHNLRHLFARTYYKVTRDVAKLADLLGHSSIDTTRIYLISTGEEHARQLNRMKLIL